MARLRVAVRPQVEERVVPAAVPRWPIVVMRTVTCLFLLLVLVQPVLAGLFITGDTDMLRLHALNATFISTASWLNVGAAAAVWRFGRGPLWPVGLTLVIGGLVEAQSGFGYSRTLALHLPLGVGLTAAATALTYWVFSQRRTR
ncbi:hypothetical protein ACT1U9_04785 [Streptomyces sp. BR1]|uniref:hypothetical protein n=1 Tax=Streptomyces sp. BR1 TaxID=1592323 RepID=UPI00402BEBE4